MNPEEFPALFARGWSLPKPDGFLEFFLPRISENAQFTQPGFPKATGHAEISRLFRRLFTLFPDLVTTPNSVAVSGETVFIGSTCETRVGRRTLRFEVCDRFVIRQNKIAERQSYSDPTSTFLSLASTPTAWKRMIQSRMRTFFPSDVVEAASKLDIQARAARARH